MRIVSAILAFCIFATSAAEARPIVVRTHGLDLARSEHADIMVRRIERAAYEACAGSFARRYPAARRAYIACRDLTVNSVIARLDAPLVAERYAARRARDGAARIG